MNKKFQSGLSFAASICRAREKAWRKHEADGGSDGFSVDHCYLRALEAMTCAEMIENLITENQDRDD